MQLTTAAQPGWPPAGRALGSMNRLTGMVVRRGVDQRALAQWLELGRPHRAPSVALLPFLGPRVTHARGRMHQGRCLHLGCGRISRLRRLTGGGAVPDSSRVGGKDLGEAAVLMSKKLVWNG